MSGPKASKLARRTLTGGAIALGLAGVLQLTTLFHSEVPVLAVALAVLLVCVREASTMGALSGRRLAWPLGAAALVVAWLTWRWFDGLDVEDREHVDLGQGPFWMLHAASWSVLTIACVYALARSSSWMVRLASIALAAVALAGPFVPGADTTQLAVLVLFFFLVLRLVAFGAERRGEALAVLTLGPLLVVSLLGLVWVWYDYSHWGLVALLAICKIGDSAGYYVGSTLGRHHPFKSISPGKTTEGCVGSLVAASLACVGAVELGWLTAGSWVGGLAAGAAVSVAAQASDLLESWVKRKAGVKDSGTWFGPSGGMLDLVDSFFLASPAALALWPWLLAY